jgi:phosphoribosylformylglycinamidine synthase
MKAHVIVTPKQSILDPQGVAVRDAMRMHGGEGVRSVRVGRFIEIDGEGLSEEKLQTLCREFLSNPVIEEFQVTIIEQ